MVEFDYVLLVSEEGLCSLHDVGVFGKEVDVVEVGYGLRVGAESDGWCMKSWSERDTGEQRTEWIPLADSLGRLKDCVTTD